MRHAIRHAWASFLWVALGSRPRLSAGHSGDWSYRLTLSLPDVRPRSILWRYRKLRRDLARCHVCGAWTGLCDAGSSEGPLGGSDAWVHECSGCARKRMPDHVI